MTEKVEEETKRKGRIIHTILRHLRFHAHAQGKKFDEGDAFLSLCFCSEQSLQEIARLAKL